MFYGKYIKSNIIEPLDRETFERLIEDPTLAGLDWEVSALYDALARGTKTKEEVDQRILMNKQKRPYICTSDFEASPQPSPKERELLAHKVIKSSPLGGELERGCHFIRSNKYALWSGLSSLDIDHIGASLSEECGVRSEELTPQSLYEERIKGHEQEWGIVAVFISPSQHGLKIIFRIGKNVDIAVAQMALAKLIGTKFDACTKDPARCTFLVSKSQWLFLDLEGMFTNNQTQQTQTPQAPHVGGCGSPSAKLASETLNGNEAAKQPESHSSSQSDELKAPTWGFGGLSYASIVSEWWNQHGTPEIGTRHAAIYQLAYNLKYICENDPKMTFDAIKTHDTFGKPDDEVLAICKDACEKRTDHLYMPKELRKVIEATPQAPHMGGCGSPYGAKIPTVWTDSQRESHTSAQSDEPEPPTWGVGGSPSLPHRLPPLVKTLISRAPKKLHPYLAMAIFPSLMVLPKRLKIVYSTNELRELAQLTLTMGPFASGKSAQNAIINAILQNVKARDRENLARLRDWLDTCKSMGANKQKPPRPDDIVIQIANPDITGARFWEMQNDLRGATMYIRMNEMDQLKKLPSWSSTMRAAFDREESGQDRVGPQSVVAHVDAMRLNVNMSSTIGNARQMLRNELRNGTLSRLTLCCTAIDDDNFDDDDDNYVFGKYDDKYYAAIAPSIANLEAATGTISCPQAQKLAKQLLEESKESALLAANSTYKDLAKRAVEQAFYRAVTLYIAQGMKWTKEIETFTRWSLEYDLWCKMYFFGDMFEAIKSESAITHRGPSNLLESLPDKFTRQEFYKLMPSGRSRRNNDMLLNVWQRRHFIEASDGLFVKIGSR